MPTAKLLLVLNEKNAKGLRTPLRKLGYQLLESVTSNEQALKKIEEDRPDLVLVGIRDDQGLGGTGFGQKIYSQYDIPIIYISDHTSHETIQRSGGTAPFGYLFYPIDEQQILATIEVAITRHAMEKKVRESEQWLNTILVCISDGVIAVDLDEHIRFINPIAEELIRMKRLDAIDRPLEDVLSLVYANTQEEVSIRHVMAYFQTQNLRTGFEALLKRKDDTGIPVEISVSPLREKGNQVGTVLAFRDISDRKKMLEEIRQHATRSEAMLKAAEQLNARLDVNAVLNTVCEICNQTLRTTTTSAFLYEPALKALVSMTLVSDYPDANETAFEGKYELPVDLFNSIISESNTIVVVDDIQALDMPSIPFMETIKEMNVRTMAISGIFQNHDLAGILVAQMHGEIRQFSEEELELMRGLTDQASIAVGNAIFFEQVLASRERQQSLSRRLVDLQEDERRNLARELHDQIGQTLTGLQFSLSALLPGSASEQKQKIVEAQKMVSSLIGQTREISMNLRPSMLDDTGLVLTLIWHFDRYTSQTEIKVNFQHHNLLDRRFETDIETAVFRIIQEALTNVARYAKTSSVDVLLQYDEQTIKIEVLDQGIGFSLEDVDTTSHMGLSSMRERAYAMRGLLEINTAPGEGTRIYSIIPVKGTIERRQHERQSSSR